MRKSPWRRPKSSMDWPEMIVTGWIVVMSAVLVGSVLSRYLYR